jgi:hypothetical protein
MNVHTFVKLLERQISTIRSSKVFSRDLNLEVYEQGLPTKCYEIALYNIAAKNKLHIAWQEPAFPLGVTDCVLSGQANDKYYLNIIHFNLALERRRKRACLNQLFMTLANSYGKRRAVIAYTDKAFSEQKLVRHCMHFYNFHISDCLEGHSFDLFLIYADASKDKMITKYKIIKLNNC